jgi:hypothetical protein
MPLAEGLSLSLVVERLIFVSRQRGNIDEVDTVTSTSLTNTREESLLQLARCN